MMRKGFLLIELLVYLCISTTLCLALMQLVTMNCAHVRKQTEHACACMELQGAQDVIRRDVRSMNGVFHAMHDGYVWNCGTQSVGVQCEQGKLIRSQGSYDYSTHQWKKRTKSLLAENIADVRISHEDAQSALVCVNLRTEQGMDVAMRCGVRNGKIR